MAHISYSELKCWDSCPFYHKLSYIDKLKVFKGNEYTAFGNAIHDTCENMLLNEQIKESDHFIDKYKEALQKLASDGYDFNKKLTLEMKEQGLGLLPQIKPALKKYFNKYKVFSTEEKLFEDTSFEDYKFKGYVDLVIKTGNGKYHIIDWKTCSWGWASKRKTDKITTYQLALYKHFFAKKHNINLKDIEVYFILLKRTAKKNNVEILKTICGNIKIKNALKLLYRALYNINNDNFIKNKLSCKFCEFKNTIHCP